MGVTFLSTPITSGLLKTIWDGEDEEEEQDTETWFREGSLNKKGLDSNASIW